MAKPEKAALIAGVFVGVLIFNIAIFGWGSQIRARHLHERLHVELSVVREAVTSGIEEIPLTAIPDYRGPSKESGDSVRSLSANTRDYPPGRIARCDQVYLVLKARHDLLVKKHGELKCSTAFQLQQ